MLRKTAEKAVRCTLMRGGSSRGPYFCAEDLPMDKASRDDFLLSVMGSPHASQINGVGGGNRLTSKVAIVSSAKNGPQHIDVLFAQVGVTERTVDTSGTCGNMLAGVGPFALERGLVSAKDGQTSVVIRTVSNDALVEAVIQTPERQVTYDGATSISGVPGLAAPVLLNFMDAVGSKTGSFFPTGRRKDVIEGVEVTLADVAVPMMLVKASDLGLKGNESAAELNGNGQLIDRLGSMRSTACQMMGLESGAGGFPKIGVLSEPRDSSAHINSRYFVPNECHATHAVTGAICIASCGCVEGTIASELMRKGESMNEVVIEHPSGVMPIRVEADKQGSGIDRVGVVQTAKKIFDGFVFA